VHTVHAERSEASVLYPWIRCRQRSVPGSFASLRKTRKASERDPVGQVYRRCRSMKLLIAQL
jgi:hypothetical protein